MASDNIRDAKTYFTNPIALSLLLATCHKVEATEQEINQAISKLKYIPPSEQIRSWTVLCFDNGIDPFKIIYPFIRSKNKGNDCMNCQHIDMQELKHPEERRVFAWTCNKHHQMLEGYFVGERVLIAPNECKDFTPPV